MSGRLTLVHAGAGTGKTHDLCESLADQVSAGADPAGILATTFTRKAAAELKGRILARLLTEARLSPAERVARASRLELAPVGTVHAVGRQLLLRYALALGLSPRLEVLESAGEERALHELLTHGDAAQDEGLTDLCNRFLLGEPHELVLGLLREARANRVDVTALRAQLVDGVGRWCEVLAPAGASYSAPGFDELYAEAETALARLRAVRDQTKVTAEALQKLRGLTQREGVYQDFVTAAKLQAGKRSGADEALDPLRDLAAGVLGSPRLHADLRALAALLAGAASDLDRAYRRYKDERGLLDFTDLETLLLDLLGQPDLAADLGSELESVAVDEFQDTNPLQLAIFQRLRWVAASSRWVGDPKQSIYAFRGTAPELVHGVLETVPASDRRRLRSCRRSVRGLVDLVGELFEPHFPGEARLGAVRAPQPRAAERWVITGRDLTEEHAGVAAGVAALHAEGVPLHAIAILARTNDKVRSLGAALEARGLPVLAELPGLLATREGALALAGLRRVADSRDDLAAAQVLHLLGDPGEETPSWLLRRLEAVAAGDRSWPGEPALRALEGLDDRGLSPTAALERVVVALDLVELAPRWGHAAARLANLDRLLQLAREWEEQTLQLGLAPTSSGLVAHLDRLGREERDTRRPPFGVGGVTVLTYHRAKGLEWPVVVLTGSPTEREVDVFKIAVSGGDPGGEDPLAGRTLRHWPWPFGRDQRGQRVTWDVVEELALESDEGRRATAEAGAEAVRLLYVGFTRARDRVVVAHRAGKAAWLAPLAELDRLLPPEPAPGEPPPSSGEDPAVASVELPLGEPPTTWVRRIVDGELAAQADAPRRDAERWLAPVGPRGAVDRAPRFCNPSRSPVRGPAAPCTVEPMGGAALFPASRAEDDVRRVGDAVHAYLAALPSLAGTVREGRGEVAARCLDGFGVGKLVEPGALVGIGERLEAWVEARYPGAEWLTEVPLSAPAAAGGHWDGVVDLLLILPDGGVVVVDHKAGPVRLADAEAKAATYAGQLAAYREALEVQGYEVRETWIHLALGGVMVGQASLSRQCATSGS